VKLAGKHVKADDAGDVIGVSGDEIGGKFLGEVYGWHSGGS
jgi:hypothetical protein